MFLLPYEHDLFNGYAEFRAHKWLEWAAAPCLMTVGTAGNLLAVWVLWRSRCGTFAYLLALGLADQLALCSGLVPNWLRHFAGFNIGLLNSAACAGSQFLFSAASQLSVWLIVAVTVERVGMVHSSSAAQHRPAPDAAASVGRARLVIGLLAGACVLANAHWLFLLRLYDHRWPGANETSPVCGIAEPHWDLAGPLAWLDSALYCILPFCIILACNCRIVHVLRLAAASPAVGQSARTLRAKSIGEAPETGASSRDRSRSSSLAVLLTSRRRQTLQQSLPQQQQRPQQPHRQSLTPGFNRNFRQLTVTLLAVSGLFLAAALPITALKVVTYLCDFVSVDDQNASFHSRYLLVQSCAQMLMYANHSANFFLYCLCGNKFRRQLRARLSGCCCRRRGGRGGGSSGGAHSNARVGAGRDRFDINGAAAVRQGGRNSAAALKYVTTDRVEIRDSSA